MGVPYKDVSAASLCFNLISGHVDISKLHPISETGLSLKVGGVALKIEMGILGASHFMSLAPAGGGRSLTEVVACTGVGSADQQLHFGPFRDKQMGSFTQSILGGALVYTFKARTELWSNDAAGFVDRLAFNIERAYSSTARPSAGLIFEFPRSSAGQTDQQPMTLVYLESEPEYGIFLQTVHSYPNDGVVVVTESKLRQGGRG